MAWTEFRPVPHGEQALLMSRLLRQLESVTDEQTGLIRASDLSENLRELLGADLQTRPDQTFKFSEIKGWLEQSKKDLFAEDRATSGLFRGLRGNGVTEENEAMAAIRKSDLPKHRNPLTARFVNLTQTDYELKTAAMNPRRRAARLADDTSPAFREARGWPGYQAFAGMNPPSELKSRSRAPYSTIAPQDGHTLQNGAEHLYQHYRSQSAMTHEYAKSIRFGPDRVADFGLAASEVAAGQMNAKDALRVGQYAEEAAMSALITAASAPDDRGRIDGDLFTSQLSRFLVRLDAELEKDPHAFLEQIGKASPPARGVAKELVDDLTRELRNLKEYNRTH